MSHTGDIRVARRYARALFNAAARRGQTDMVQTDLNALGRTWRETPTLQRTMESPLIPGERKKELVDRLLAKDLDPVTRSFLHLLVDKRREGIFLAVLDEYVRLADQARGLVRAQAVVAAPMDEPQRQELVSGLEKRTGKRIELNVSVDPQILGGVVVRMEDTVIDGSVRGALERLREQMLAER